MKNSYIISCPSAEYSKNGIIYFRRRFEAKAGEQFRIKIFADARYKLYMNGTFVNVGPAKGNDKELYYDELELGKYLCDGENRMDISVLCLARAEKAEGHRYVTSLHRSGRGVLEISGILAGNVFITDKNWDCAAETGTEFIVPEYAYYTGLPEHADTDYKKPVWEKAKELFLGDQTMIYGEPSMWYSYKSPIPAPRLEKMKLNLSRDAVLDFGYLTTAYLEIPCKGRGKIKLIYAERYNKEGSDDREDKDGGIFGDYDIIDLDGETVFEPFWFRCFRFIRVETEGEVEFGDAYAYETGYPIEVSSGYDFGSNADNKLWEISVRTLQRCMQDTFCDCPYYEQLQYAMDTHLQCIFAYQISGDDRLQRRAIRDFAMSVGPEGISQSRTPSVQKQYIPGFALFYIMMVLEHFDRFGDRELLEENMPQIIQVLSWYRRHSREDYLVTASEYWHFIDWSDNFTNSPNGRGVPVMEKDASLGIESLMLSYVLQNIAKAVTDTAFDSLADGYSRWAKEINSSAERLYYSEDKMLYSDTEYKRHYSQQMQIWAVLSGCADGERAQQIMKRSFEITGGQATFAYAYLLFRALEKAELYNLRQDMLSRLRRLAEHHCTTVPETPKDARSECHAWGAVVLYEFTAMDLGVKQLDGKIVIKPYIKERESAKGTVYTAGGAVYVSWRKRDGRLYLYCKTPDGVVPEIICDSGCEAVVCSSEEEVDL